MPTPDDLPPIDVLERSRADWNAAHRDQCRWSIPVDPGTIARARTGDWQVILTLNLSVPGEWLGDIRGRDVLCLASGGGQQASVLAAAGARVTSYDLSDAQLAKDQLVAEREGLPLTCIRDDMARASISSSIRFPMSLSKMSAPCGPNVFASCVRAGRCWPGS